MDMLELNVLGHVGRLCGSNSSRLRSAIIAAAVLMLSFGAAPIGATTFPLKVSANGRYLVDQNNVGFRVQGDSPWDVLVSLTASNVDTYLANRAAKGFNTLLVELVERKARAGSPAPANKAGALPFVKQLGGAAYTGATVLADLSTPNDAYFAYVDSVLAKLAAQNMVALLTPLYVGYGGDLTPGVNNEGWSAEMNANSSAQCYAYGQYVGDRYRNQKNIIWVEGGDWSLQAPTPAAIRTCGLQVMQGIKDGKGSGGSSALQTAHWIRGQISTDDAGFAGQVNVNSVYALPSAMATLCRTAYSRAPVLPAYVIEGYYEGEHAMTREGLRQEGYWAALSCIGGYVFGNAPLWLFDTRVADGPGRAGVAGHAAHGGGAGQCGLAEPGAVEPGGAERDGAGAGERHCPGRGCGGGGEQYGAGGVPAVDGDDGADDHGDDVGAGGLCAGALVQPGERGL